MKSRDEETVGEQKTYNLNFGKLNLCKKKDIRFCGLNGKIHSIDNTLITSNTTELGSLMDFLGFAMFFLCFRIFMKYETFIPLCTGVMWIE